MVNLQFLLIIIGFTLYLIHYLKNYLRLVRLTLKLNGPPVVPFFGNVFSLSNCKTMYKIAIDAPRYGKLIRFWASFIPVIVVYEPEHLQIILSNSKKSKKNIFYSLLDTLIGPGLVSLNGNEWKTHRKLIQPFFRGKFLENYIGIFEDGAHLLVNKVKEKQNVKITTYINDCIINTLFKSVMGIDHEKTQIDTPYRKGQLNLTYRLARPWLLVESIFKFTSTANKEDNRRVNLYLFTKKIMEARKKQMSLTSNCLMDMLLEISENNPEFTEEDVIHEICTFMLAGQDSSATALATALFFIAKHKDVQDKIIEEQNLIFSDKNAPISMDDLHKMVYLEMCIKENLRLCPTIPIFSRELLEDVVLDQHTIPKGSNIVMSPFITHRLHHLYPDSETFNPDRFLPENINKIHPYSYLPFSGGSRNCIGSKFAMLKLKTFLSVFLRNYEIDLVPNCDKLIFMYKISLGVKGGVRLRLTPRQ